jgi:beta-1,4-N-acetylglucosaminyltransferase
MSSTDLNKKVCFVTTGATAPFTGLIESVLQPSSIDALREGGYTHLLIQYGSAKHVMSKHAEIAVQRLKDERGNTPLDIDGFDFDKDGLKTQFKMVHDSKGLIISHAGMST